MNSKAFHYNKATVSIDLPEPTPKDPIVSVTIQAPLSEIMAVRYYLGGNKSTPGNHTLDIMQALAEALCSYGAR